MTRRTASGEPPKIPVSVLVVIHTPDGQILLLERADRPGFWQSVTGSLDAPDEPPEQAAAREVFEETGLQAHGLQDLHIRNRYEIFAHWRHRYGPGVTHNTEHVFALPLPAPCAIRLAPREHLAFAWLPWAEAAARCFSPSNAQAIRLLASRLGWSGRAVSANDPAPGVQPVSGVDPAPAVQPAPDARSVQGVRPVPGCSAPGEGPATPAGPAPRPAP